MGGSSGTRRGWIAYGRRRWWLAGLLVAAFPAWADPAADGATVLAFGSAGPVEVAPAPRLSLSVNPAFAPTVPGVPGQEVGVQWRQPIGSHSVDVTAWRRFEPVDAMNLIRQRDPVLGARVEIRLGAARRGFVAEHRFLGVQLDNGGKIGLRRKDGNPAITYRQSF